MQRLWGRAGERAAWRGVVVEGIMMHGALRESRGG